MQHLKSTPSDYFWWRFKSGEDREGLEKVTRKVTPAEAAQKDADIKAVRGMQGLDMACRVLRSACLHARLNSSFPALHRQ